MARLTGSRLHITSVAVATLSVFASVPAFAQTEPVGDFIVTGGAELVSDYRFRGLSLSGGDVAFQPTIHIEHSSGLYAGVWGSNIEDSATYGEIELDLYGGYSTEIASGTVLDVGMTYYYYPDGEKSAGPSDYFEMVGKLSHTLGPVEATGTVGYSWDQAALGGDDNLYLGLGLAAGVPNTPVTLNASVGHSDGALASYAANGQYWDWSVGASAVFGPVTAGVKYVDTNIPTIGVKSLDKYYNARVVFSLGLFF